MTDCAELKMIWSPIGLASRQIAATAYHMSVERPNQTAETKKLPPELFAFDRLVSGPLIIEDWKTPCTHGKYECPNQRTAHNKYWNLNNQRGWEEPPGKPLHTVFAAEFINPTGSIENLLFAGIERMARRADFDTQFVRQGRTG